MAKHRHARVYFTPEVAEEILGRIMGGESLLRICGPDREPGLPDRLTVHQHMRQDKAFRLAYLLAREAQAETLAQEVLDIADGRHTPPGQVADVSRDRLRVNARRWLAGVLAPRVYGARAALRDELAELEQMAAPERQDHIAARIAAILEGARRRRIARLEASERGEVATCLAAPMPEEADGDADEA